MANAQVIRVNDIAQATQSMFGRPMQSAQQYMGSTVNNFVAQATGVAAQSAVQMVDRFNTLTSASYLATVDNMRNQLMSTWATDSVRFLPTINEIQEAPLSMQRWVVANPTLRESYNRDGLSAYDGGYHDIRPGGVGVDHYDFRRVMNGVVSTTDSITTSTQYHEPLVSAEDVLSIVNKSDILRTWDVIDAAIEEGITADPTSQLNELLG